METSRRKSQHMQIRGSNQFLFILLIIFLVGCNVSLPASHNGRRSQVNLADIFKGDCEPPCWNGIIPGKTGYEDFHQTLEMLPDVDTNSIVEHPMNAPEEPVQLEIRWDFCSGCKLRSGRALLGQRLNQLNLEVDGTIPVQQFIDYFGEPKYVDIDSPPTAKISCEVFFGWPDQGVLAGYYQEGSYSVCEQIESGEGISPGLSVTRIVLLPIGPEFQKLKPCCERYEYPGSN